MAVVTGNDYDHIDIVNGSTQTRHMIKDASARADVADLKSALTASKKQADADISGILTNRKIIEDYMLGRFVSDGFYDATTKYIRNSIPFPAGTYQIKSFPVGSRACQYVSDTSGTWLTSTYSVGNYQVVATGPWYINFNSANSFTDSDIENIENNFELIKVAESNTLENRMETAENDIDDLQNTVDEFEQVIGTAYPKNVYDMTIEAGYLTSTGGISQSTNYKTASDYADLSRNESDNIVVSFASTLAQSGLRWCFYDSENTYVPNSYAVFDSADMEIDATTGRYYIVIVQPQDAASIRFSAKNAWFDADTWQIEYGSIPTAYEQYHAPTRTLDGDLLRNCEPFVELETEVDELKRQSADISNLPIINDMTIGKKPGQNKLATFSANDSIVVGTNSVLKNQRIIFTANVGTMGEIRVGHCRPTGNYGYLIIVDDTKMQYATRSSTGSSVSHGLTINDWIMISIDIDDKLNVKTTIATTSGVFTKEQQINASWCGDIIAECVSGTFTNAVLTWVSGDYKKPLWAFGDSYFTLYSASRWPYYVFKSWDLGNALLNAYPGEGSQRAYLDLQDNLQYGTPKVILWCLGMNDPDTDSAANTNWQTTVESLMELCQQKNITLILATIPVVTNASYKNNYKNSYVRNSGLRYVDFAGAIDGVDGWLSDDGVHPSEIGAKVLAIKAITDCPELLQ